MFKKAYDYVINFFRALFLGIEPPPAVEKKAPRVRKPSAIKAPKKKQAIKTPKK